MNEFTFWRAWLHTENITLLGRLFPLLIWCDATFSHESPIHASLSSKGKIVCSVGYFCGIFCFVFLCVGGYFLWGILSHWSMLQIAVDHQRAQSCALGDIFRTFLLLILTSRSNTQTILFGHWFVLFTCRTICLFILMPLVTNDWCPYPPYICVRKSEITLTTFLSAEKDHWVTALHSLGWWKTSRTHWSSIAAPSPSLCPPAYLSITTQGTVWPNIAEMSVLYLLKMKLRSSVGVCFFWQWFDKVRPNTLSQIESSHSILFWWKQVNLLY